MRYDIKICYVCRSEVGLLWWLVGLYTACIFHLWKLARLWSLMERVPWIFLNSILIIQCYSVCLPILTWHVCNESSRTSLVLGDRVFVFHWEVTRSRDLVLPPSPPAADLAVRWRQPRHLATRCPATVHATTHLKFHFEFPAIILLSASP